MSPVRMGIDSDGARVSKKAGPPLSEDSRSDLRAAFGRGRRGEWRKKKRRVGIMVMVMAMVRERVLGRREKTAMPLQYRDDQPLLLLLLLLSSLSLSE